MKKRGFTLMEVIIIMLIIVLLVAIAVPNYMKAQTEVKRVTCISNLQKMDEAIERYASSENKSASDAVYLTTIIPEFLRLRPTCPSRGSYTLTTVGQNPTCSMELTLSHKLP